MTKIKNVVKRSGATVPFNPDRITNAIYRAAVAVGGRDRSIAEGLSAKVTQYLEKNLPPGHTPSVEEIQDAVEKVLVEEGHSQTAKAYIIYRQERAKQREREAQDGPRLSQNIPWEKIWHVLDWAVTHGVHTIESYNQRLESGDLAEIIEVAEAAYNKDVSEATESIIERAEEVRMVLITGPSSSGKTTTTIKIGQRLEKEGLKLVALNVDNYFFDLELHPKDEFGDYDFETPQALDLALINEHLQALFAGKEVLIPYYDFKTGERQDEHTPMQLKEKEILLIDSLHGLFPDMTRTIPDEQKFKLYLEPLLQMKDSRGKYVRWTDIRLIRRMLRDASHRAYKPRSTLEHWHYVRASELRNIIPYVNTADHIINSAMPFELSLYRARLGADFAQWEKDYHDDPLREDAYTRAKRVHAVLEEILPIEDDGPVPKDSVLREFIGGSVYQY